MPPYTNKNAHQKLQSMDISSVFKGNNNSNTQNQMPSITTISSPKAAISLNNSIERINKGINDSINKNNHKEIQLIQAY